MATYDNLPVYKASYELLVEIFQFSKNFSKEYKYTVGEKLKNETLEMIMNIYRANSREHKKELLQTARENIEVNRLLLRLVKELNDYFTWLFPGATGTTMARSTIWATTPTFGVLRRTVAQTRGTRH